jgi:flagellar basal-body rod protein FlgB
LLEFGRPLAGDDVRMIDGVTNSDALPVLERFVQFAGARHRLIVHNIANLSTPDFRPTDVSTEDFQATLGAAVDARRERHGVTGGDLPLESSREVQVSGDRLIVQPRPTGENILFHDRNDRDAERIMQDLVENFMAFRTASEFMRSRHELLNTAIRERI